MNMSMTCIACGHQTARLNVAKTVGHLREELWLCDDCARRIGIESPHEAYSATEILSGLFEGVDDRATTELTCPNCGMTAHDLRQKGRAGCEQCYEVFVSLMRELTIDPAGAPAHRGRYPRHLQQIKRILVDRVLVRRRLDDAVAQENFELAARLRDRLQRFESEPHGAPDLDRGADQPDAAE